MTRRALAAFILLGITLIIGMATGRDLIYQLAYALALVLGASYLWTRLNLRALFLEVDRRAIGAQVGEWLEERITARNKSRLPKNWLVVEDLNDIPGHRTARVVSIPGRRFRSWRVRSRCRRRGIYTLGPVAARSGDPFGLFSMERRFGDPVQVTIFPATVALPTFQLPTANLPGEGALRRRTYRVTPQASTVREYAHGDSLSRIHWPSTARMGRLMSKEFDVGLLSDLWLFLDLQAQVHIEEGDESTDELCVTIAASIARKYLDAERTVGLVAPGDRDYIVPLERGADQMARILATLTVARAEGSTPVGEALAFHQALFSHYATLVVITPSTSDAWAPALRDLGRRSIGVAVVLVDPASFGGALGPQETLATLASSGITTYLVQRGDDLAHALAYPAGWREVWPGKETA